MILSAEDLFSDGQSVTASGASTNYYDLGAPGTVLGAPGALSISNFSSMIPIWVSADAAATGTSPTCSVQVEQDDNTSFSSATAVGGSFSLGTAAGAVAAIQILPEDITERYIRLQYTLGGTSPVFTITAGIVGARQTNDR